MATFSDKQWVWYMDTDNYFHAAQFQGNNGSNYNLVNIEGQAVSIPKANVKPMHPTSISGVEDMITLGDLHEAALLHNISQRLMKDEVYTYTGNILVAANPYKSLPIYGGDYIQRYKGRGLGDLPPHIYAIANEIFYTMRKNNQNHGESGAGKTESTKLILNFLATVSSSKSLVQDQILDASPILEAFGNAKTVRNDNSSRFGKFLEVQFDERGGIAGALTLQYLLEKSRIVKQAPDERNYHIFYALIAGASAEERQELGLRQPQDFFYLNQSECISMPNINDAGTLKEVREAFLTLNFKKFEKQIWQALAAILHLGNITFIESFGQNMEGVTIKDPSIVPTAARLLGVDPAKLKHVLMNRTTVTRGETIVTPLNVVQAIDGRDAMAKAIYGRMFSWIVTSINEATAKNPANYHFVGVLDIFGFEDFKINSFEQLCINFANERLQYYFNMHIFKMEQEEYTKEGINWSKIEFSDNQATIDLIAKKPVGLMLLLDDESTFSKSTDMTLLGKFQQSHLESKVFLKGKTATSFGIHHYAGDVCYQIEGFLEKNRDTLRQDLQEMLCSSKEDLILKWFTQPAEEPISDGASTISSISSTSSRSSTTTRKSSKSPTTGYQFTASLNELITTLTACNPFFVRCIKPNPQKKTRTVDRSLMIAQLSYSGMLETVRVRRAGYSYRTTFTDFLSRYGIIMAGIKKIALTAPGEACKKILTENKDIAKDMWELGKTKVFMKSAAENVLDGLRAEKIMVFVLKLQAYFRMIVYKRKYERLKVAIPKLQRAFRRHRARRHFKNMRKGIIKAQALFRGYRVRKRFGKQMSGIRNKQKAEEARRVADKKQGKIAAEEDALSIHSVNENISKGDLIDGRRIPWASPVRPLIQKFSGLPLLSPLSTNEFLHLTTQTASLDPKNVKAADVSESEDGTLSWLSFCRVFFRESAKPRWSSRVIKESLLKWPQECNHIARRLYKTLLKLVVDDLGAEEFYIAVNYLAFKVVRMTDKEFEVPGNFRFYDELLCQIVKITYENPDKHLTLKAWKLLALFLGHFPPTSSLLKAILCYIGSDCPDPDTAEMCKYRLARSNGRGPRRRGFTSVEVTGFFNEDAPIVLQAEWIDGRNPIPFEIDPACTPYDVIGNLTQIKGLRSDEGYSMVVIFPDGRQLRLSLFDNILDMLSLAELESKRMRQDLSQDPEVDSIEGRRKKPSGPAPQPPYAVPSIPAPGQMNPAMMQPMIAQNLPPPILSSGIRPPIIQGQPGMSRPIDGPSTIPIAIPKIMGPGGAVIPPPGIIPNIPQGLRAAPGGPSGPIPRRMTAPPAMPANLLPPPGQLPPGMPQARPPRPSPGPPPPMQPMQPMGMPRPPLQMPMGSPHSPQVIPGYNYQQMQTGGPPQILMSPHPQQPQQQQQPQQPQQQQQQQQFEPVTNSYPWRLIIKKSYMNPAFMPDDPLDIKLTIEQLQQDARTGDPYISHEFMPQFMQILNSGNPVAAIKFAALWPMYFLQNFTVVCDDVNSGGYTEFGVHMKGIVLSARGPDYVSRLISRFRFDDLLLGDLEGDVVSIWLDENLHKFRFQGPKLAALANVLMKSYIEELKDSSNVAVALVSYTAEDGSTFSFHKGQIIEILERDRINGYFCGKVDGKTGWFPQDVAEIILSEPQLLGNGLVNFKGALLKKADAAEARMALLRNDSKGLASTDSLVQNALISMFNPETGTSDKQQYSFMDYAKEYFQKDFSLTGTIRSMSMKGSMVAFRRSSTGSASIASSVNKTPIDPKELAKLVSFSSKPLKQPLTRISSPAEFNAAVTAFTFLMQFMGDLPTRQEKFILASALVGMAMAHPELLADELYCQIIKQTINNKGRKENSLKMGWQLLYIFCVFIVPSSTFEPYLRGHLNTCASDKSRSFSQEASNCVQVLLRNKLSPRVSNITPSEYNSFFTGIKRRVKVYLPDGTFGIITVDTHNTPRDFLIKFAEQFGFKPIEELGLWIVYQPGDFIAMPMNSSSKVADILTNIEAELAESGGKYLDFQVKLFRKLWISDTELSSDYSIVTIFNQLVTNYMSGFVFTSDDFAPPNRARLIRLIGLFTSIKRKGSSSATFKLSSCIPPVISSMYPPAEWDNQLAPQIEQFSKLGEKEAQSQFIKEAKQCGNYGFSSFVIGQTTDPRIPPGCILGVGAKGVRIIEPSKRVILETFGFGEIVNFRFEPTEFAIRAAKAGENVVIRMETPQGPIIGDLISSYITMLNKIEAQKQQEAGGVNVLAAEINAIV